MKKAKKENIRLMFSNSKTGDEIDLYLVRDNGDTLYVAKPINLEWREIGYGGQYGEPSLTIPECDTIKFVNRLLDTVIENGYSHLITNPNFKNWVAFFSDYQTRIGRELANNEKLIDCRLKQLESSIKRDIEKELPSKILSVIKNKLDDSDPYED